jgi:hypothetical protein
MRSAIPASREDIVNIPHPGCRFGAGGGRLECTGQKVAIARSRVDTGPAAVLTRKVAL